MFIKCLRRVLEVINTSDMWKNEITGEFSGIIWPNILKGFYHIEKMYEDFRSM